MKWTAAIIKDGFKEKLSFFKLRPREQADIKKTPNVSSLIMYFNIFLYIC